MTTLGERITLIMNSKGIKAPGLARILGQSERSVYNYIDNKNAPTAPILCTILQETPGLSAHWLLTGDGEMWIAASELKGALRAQVAYNIGGDNTQLHIAEPAAPYDPCASLRTEVAYLRQQVADKEEIIGLLKAAQK